MTDVFSRPWRFPAEYHGDEDINSLVVRMAEKGCMSSAQFMRYYLKVTTVMLNEGTYEVPVLRKLAMLAGVEEGEILSNAMISKGIVKGGLKPGGIQFRGEPLLAGSLHMRKRVAPGMLKADGAKPYIRVAWRFDTLVGDPMSGEVLQSRCPNCLRELRWRSPKLCLCDHCRFDIREATPVFLAERDLDAIRKLANALGVLGSTSSQPLKLSPPFADLDLHEQLGALAWLAGLKGRMEGTLLTAAASNSYLGLELAENWDRTVQELVALVFRQTAGETKDIVRDLVGHFDSIRNPQLKTRLVETVARHAAIVAADRASTPHWGEAKLPHYMAAFPRYALSAREPGEKRSAKSVNRPKPARSSR